MAKLERARYWAFLTYPENMVTSFESAEVFGIPFAVSPLHTIPDSDDEKQMKPHYHVLCDFRSYISQSKVQKFSDQFSHVNCFSVSCPTGYYDYLTHKNNPKKEQFLVDPILYNGFEVPTKKDDGIINDLSYIYSVIFEEKGLCSYSDCVQYFLATDVRFLPVLTRNAYAVSLFIDRLKDREGVRK